MFDKPGFIRFVATLLLGALAAITAVGVMRWSEITPAQPPEGRWAAAACGLAAIYGLVVLWKPDRSRA